MMKSSMTKLRKVSEQMAPASLKCEVKEKEGNFFNVREELHQIRNRLTELQEQYELLLRLSRRNDFTKRILLLPDEVLLVVL